MKKAYIYNLVGISLIVGYITAQNNALYLNGAYIYMNGGTSATPIYLTINQPNTAGIVRTAGHIHSENQYNYVQWITGTNTGSYVIPFGVGGNAADYIPLGFNKTNAAMLHSLFPRILLMLQIIQCPVLLLAMDQELPQCHLFLNLQMPLIDIGTLKPTLLSMQV